MRAQKRTYDMSDRELRAYKRQLRRERECRRRWLATILTVCLIFGGAISYCAIRSNASTGNDTLKFKYYTRVSVDYGETLWQLADEYIDYEMYDDKTDYISEVVSINHLEDSDSLIEGQHLIVPYYSTEFVQ